MIKKLGLIEGVLMKHYFKEGYNNLDSFNSWATRWKLSILVNNGLTIIPGVNLAVNIGTDGGAHFEKGDIDPLAGLCIGKLEWPIIYNDSFIIDKKQAKYDQSFFIHVRRIGLVKKIRRLLHIHE